MRIGLFVNTLNEEYQVSIYRSIQNRARELGLDLLCVQQERINPALESYDRLFPAKEFISVDGVLILSPVIADYINSASFPDLRSVFPGLPVVSIGTNLSCIPSIIIKSRDSMEELMQHLLYVHKYRHFVFLGGHRAHRDNIVRERVFCKSLETAQVHNPDIRYDILHGEFDESSGTLLMNEYYASNVNNPPDCVVAASDAMAIGALKVLKTRTDPRWQNCAVTGFDDIPRAKMSLPPLTTIKQPFEQMGANAVDTLYRLMRKYPAESLIKIPSKLYIRNSCGCTEAYRDNTFAENEQELHDTKAALVRIQYQTIRADRFMRNITLLGQRLNTVNSLHESSDFLREYLDNLEIPVFYLLLFQEPMYQHPPQTAKIVYCKKNSIEYESFNNPQIVDLKQFFKETVFEGGTGALSRDMRYLNSGQTIFGLIIYEAEDTVHPHMCNCSMFIANTLQRFRLLQDEKDRALQLEKEVAHRTKDLTDANKKLKKESKRRIKVEAEVLSISEQERMRFSMDLHDDICQRLAGISMKCRGLATGTPKLLELSEQIDETLQRTRQYAHNSFPVDLDSLGMKQSVDNLCHTFSKQTNCKFLFSWDAPEKLGITRIQGINIFRIIQEALHNVIKHAKATEVTVSFTYTGSMLTVKISDNGTGIKRKSNAHNPKQPQGLGLCSMQYRADQIGAKYSLISSEQCGTSIILELPFHVNTNHKPS